MQNIGIYIHYPFCKRKCHYCDFYSTIDLNKQSIYIDTLIKEIELRHFGSGVIEAETLFIGGGTPSLIEPNQLEKILSALQKKYHFSYDAEITMECNPGATDSTFFADYKSLGINRLSIGVQSFDDAELKFLQRIHSSDEAKRTITKACEIFDNVSVDLIFGLPKQNYSTLQSSLETALSFDIKHLSVYNLIFEEDTPLYLDLLAGKVEETDGDLASDMYETFVAFLENKGYFQYEISNFAKQGFESKHNMKYWLGENVVAFGPSAVGLFDGRRYKNYADLKEYTKSLSLGILPEKENEILNQESMISETIFLGLRSKGINFNNFELKYGIDLKSKIEDEISMLVANGFARFDGRTLRLSPRGYFISDEITLRIMEKIQGLNNV